MITEAQRVITILTRSVTAPGTFDDSHPDFDSVLESTIIQEIANITLDTEGQIIPHRASKLRGAIPNINIGVCPEGWHDAVLTIDAPPGKVTIGIDLL